MLNENLKTLRKSRGLSQEELAVKLNVVRQTISKWEKGISVPDSEMLVLISEHLEIPVSTLLGENIVEARQDELKVISEKLEIINLQFSKRNTIKRNTIYFFLISMCMTILILFLMLIGFESPYLAWDYNEPETAVLGVAIHSLEWAFVRVAPIMFLVGIVGVVFMRKR